MSVLQIINVDVSFGTFQVLKKTCLDMEHGLRLGIMGANGSGKSTLLGVIGGQIKPRSGTVLLDGHDVSRMSPSQRSQLGLSRMFQGSRLWDDMTVAEHLQVMLDTKRQGHVALDLLMQALGVTSRFFGCFPIELTLVQRRAVELCMALYGTRVLLCDELGAGLSTPEASALYQALSFSIERGWIDAVLMVEHRAELLSGYTDEIANMNGGVLDRLKKHQRFRYASGKTAEVINRAAITA